MKKQTFIKTVIVPAAALAFGWPAAIHARAADETSGASSPAPSASAAASPSASESESLSDTMQQLEKRMDSLFTDTFKNLGSGFEHARFSSSVDVREQKDKYVVRFYVPDADNANINAKLEGNTLHFTAQTTKQDQSTASSSQQYEQIITLPGPVQADKMIVDHKQGLVVVTLPKAEQTGATASTSVTPAPSQAFADWDQQIFREMERMQGRMEQLFRDAFPDENVPQNLNAMNTARFGSAVNVEDQKDKYVAHFYLPDRDLANVNVKVENNQLKLTAKDEKTTENKNAAGGSFESFQSGNYEQVVALPGPVKADKMKVEKKNGAVIVTLPKA